MLSIWHWLTEDGHFPDDNMRLRRRVVRIARLIEYGGPLARGESRETLVECSKRPGRKQCLGLLWITKTEQDAIFAYCPICREDKVMIHNWQDTLWADGMMEPVPPDGLPPTLNAGAHSTQDLQVYLEEMVEEGTGTGRADGGEVPIEV